MIKNIVFDMGNVLILYDAKRYIEAYCGHDEGDRMLLFQEVFQGVEWIMTDRGTMNDHQAVASICKRIPDRLHSAVGQLFDHWHEDLPPIPGMEDLIIRLKSAGYGIYLLSNTCKNYHTYRKNIPAISQFDGEFISADWHLLKPGEEIFRTFCSHFSLVPGECFFIDDMPANVEGAFQIGMEGFIYRQNIETLEKALFETGIIF